MADSIYLTKEGRNKMLEELERLKNGTQLYTGRLDRIERIMGGQTGKARDPRKLAEVYLRIVTARRPRMRYDVHANLLLKFYSAAPRRLQALALRLLLEESNK
jgi:hypothetical protein